VTFTQTIEHWSRCVALGVFAGATSAGFAAGAALMLDLSPWIAGTVTGVVTAVIVALVRHRQSKIGATSC
jgi:hypothetical protein